MQVNKPVFRPIVLALSALLSTSTFAQSIVFTNTSSGQQVLGESYVKVYDYGTRLQGNFTEAELSFVDFNNFNTTGTAITATGITTQALAAKPNLTLAISGNVDFSAATVTGLGGGSFNPAEVTSSLIGGTTTGGTFTASGYSVDLVSGAAALGATTVVGATNINTTGTAATKIGNANAAATVVGSVVTATAGNSSLALQSGEARLTVTNAAGNTHGLVVGESSTTLSGGTQSTSLTLNDQGATFSNAATGAPARVTGVANGSGDFDAVNVRQFGSAVAGAHAVANIPGVDTNKTSSLGVGLGHFMNQQALAFGGTYRFSDKGVLRASLSTGLNSGGNKTAFGVGAGWSW